MGDVVRPLLRLTLYAGRLAAPAGEEPWVAGLYVTDRSTAPRPGARCVDPDYHGNAQLAWDIVPRPTLPSPGTVLVERRDGAQWTRAHVFSYDGIPTMPDPARGATMGGARIVDVRAAPIVVPADLPARLWFQLNPSADPYVVQVQCEKAAPKPGVDRVGDRLLCYRLLRMVVSTTDAARAAADAPRAIADAPRVTTDTARVTTDAARVTTDASRATADASRATADAPRAGADAPRVTGTPAPPP